MRATGQAPVSARIATQTTAPTTRLSATKRAALSPGTRARETSSLSRLHGPQLLRTGAGANHGEATRTRPMPHTSPHTIAITLAPIPAGRPGRSRPP